MKRHKLAAVLVAIGWVLVGAAIAGNAVKPPSQQSTDGNAAIRAIVAKFERDDPGWKVRMESLVRIAGAGPVAVPVLIERLTNGPPTVREFSAQALAILADARSRPALLAALKDDSPQVRVYAVCGLGALDKTPASTKSLQTVVDQDTAWPVRHAAAWALERDDAGAAAAIVRELSAYDLRSMDTARLDEPAPDFSLTDIHGKTYRLADFRGKQSVILKFYQEPL